MTEIYLALVTCPQGSGQKIAHQLLAEKLAACINIIPLVNSIYSWQNEIREDKEELLLIKTTNEVWHNFVKRTKELHTYEVPEIICLSLKDGYPPYLAWLESCLKNQI